MGPKSVKQSTGSVVRHLKNDCIDRVLRGETLSLYCNFGERRRLSGLVLNDCVLSGTRLDGATLHGVDVADLRTKRLCQIRASVFSRCTVRGRIGSIQIQPVADGQWVDPASYRDVEWALDLRAANPTGPVSLAGVPGALVLREDRHQVLLVRERFVAAFGRPDTADALRVFSWCRGLSERIGLSQVPAGLWEFLAYPVFDSLALVARSGAPRRVLEVDLDDFRRLASLGVVDFE